MKPRLADLPSPLAIAMWDFTWLHRHQANDDFEDFDRRLDELVERGYNAVRIDCYPHLVASDTDGRIQESFFCPKDSLVHTLWGAQYSITVRPRDSLVDFLKKCEARDIRVGLSTWMGPHGIGRNADVEGVSGFVRVWHETLTFLEEKGLLENILYVDLLNEYPLWHGFAWLHDQLQQLSDEADQPPSDLAKVHEQNVLEGLVTERKFNERQIDFYNRVLNDSIAALQEHWPNLDFFASVTRSFDVPWQDLDFSRSAALDMHVWFVHHRDFSLHTGYFKDIHPRTNDQAFDSCYGKIRDYWKTEKAAMVDWMDQEISEAAAFARSRNMAVGNTEGWGPIIWMDHPHLDWDWVKESGEICVDLAVKHGYHFICTSNFTHPQFPGIWDDIAWHQQLTQTIKTKLL